MSIAAAWALAKGAAANWKYVVMGLLLVWACVAQLGWDHCAASAVADRLAQAEAVRKQTEKAESLSNELIIAQAVAMGVTERTSVEYVDRIKTVQVPAECPADERDRLGSRGVRDILGGSQPAPK